MRRCQARAMEVPAATWRLMRFINSVVRDCCLRMGWYMLDLDPIAKFGHSTDGFLLTIRRVCSKKAYTPRHRTGTVAVCGRVVRELRRMQRVICMSRPETENLVSHLRCNWATALSNSPRAVELFPLRTISVHLIQTP